MGFLFSLPGKILIAATVVILAYVGGQWHGRDIASTKARMEAAETSARILRKRGDIDEDVSTSDATALCADFGLSDSDKAECVRRLQEADSGAGHDSVHSEE